MLRENFNDLRAFVAVARAGSFTRAAAQLGVTQSALSHVMRSLEQRLGMRLLERSTRSISTTKAGERLFLAMAPRFEEIDDIVAAVRDARDRPVGTVRITASEHAADQLLWPRLAPLLSRHPEVRVEISVDHGLTDIVAQRYDIGVRLGDQVARDMIAVRIGPDIRMAVVGSPDYFRSHPQPSTPNDLARHNCINLRLPTYGGLLAWELENSEREVRVQVQGQWTFNSATPIRRAALAGAGLAWVPEDMILQDLAQGSLIRVLDDWCLPFSGYHLYYANKRRHSRALALVVDALRYTAPQT